MPDKIILRGSKAFGVGWDSKKKKHFEKEVDSLIPYLQCPVEIESGTKFSDLWHLIVLDQKILQLVFMSALGSHPLSIYIEEAKKPSKNEPKDPNDSIQFLEFSWGNEYHKDYDEPSKFEFCLYPDLHGWGKTKDTTQAGKIVDTAWAIDLTPVNEWMDYEIKLHETLTVNDVYVSSKEIKNILVARYGFTVYDILNAVFEEISFFGAPDKRDATLKDIAGRKDQLDKDIASGNTKGYTEMHFDKKGKMVWEPLKSWKENQEGNLR